MTIHTLDEVQAIAADLLASHGADFVYEQQPDNLGVKSCRYYTTDGQPSCFVGHVFDRWADERLTLAAKAADLGSGTSAREVALSVDADVEDEVLTYLDGVQEWQDAGQSWGASVLHAEHVCGFHRITPVDGCPNCDADNCSHPTMTLGDDLMLACSVCGNTVTATDLDIQ